jgi:hypothetical protein
VALAPVVEGKQGLSVELGEIRSLYQLPTVQYCYNISIKARLHPDNISQANRNSCTTNEQEKV